jgi:hypothetical protein
LEAESKLEKELQELIHLQKITGTVVIQLLDTQRKIALGFDIHGFS